jgi:hypothetical protein
MEKPEFSSNEWQRILNEIGKGRALNEKEVNFVVVLIMGRIERHIRWKNL